MWTLSHRISRHPLRYATHAQRVITGRALWKRSLAHHAAAARPGGWRLEGGGEGHGGGHTVDVRRAGGEAQLQLRP